MIYDQLHDDELLTLPDDQLAEAYTETGRTITEIDRAITSSGERDFSRRQRIQRQDYVRRYNKIGAEIQRRRQPRKPFAVLADLVDELRYCDLDGQTALLDLLSEAGRIVDAGREKAAGPNATLQAVVPPSKRKRKRGNHAR